MERRTRLPCHLNDRQSLAGGPGQDIKGVPELPSRMPSAAARDHSTFSGLGAAEILQLAPGGRRIPMSHSSVRRLPTCPVGSARRFKDGVHFAREATPEERPALLAYLRKRQARTGVSRPLALCGPDDVPPP